MLRRTASPLVPAMARRRTIPVVPTGLRVYAVGDIHGRADCLAQVFSRIDADRQRFPIDETLEIYLGDYIDRGSQSRAVIDLLLERRSRRSCIYLLGNHEMMLNEAVHSSAVASAWRRGGGGATLAAYGVYGAETATAEAWPEQIDRFRAVFPAKHAHFLRGCRLSYACGTYFFVHAGIRPGVSVEGQSARDLLWIRDPFLSSKADHGAIIVHGHTPVREPDFHPNRINLDTGAYLTGHLACVAFEGNVMDQI